MAYSEELNTPKFVTYNNNTRINSQARATRPKRSAQQPSYKKDVFILNAF